MLPVLRGGRRVGILGSICPTSLGEAWTGSLESTPLPSVAQCAVGGSKPRLNRALDKHAGVIDGWCVDQLDGQARSKLIQPRLEQRHAEKVLAVSEVAAADLVAWALEAYATDAAWTMQLTS